MVDSPEQNTEGEQFETLWETSAFRLERIISRGHSSPTDFWYDQSWDEWVVILGGRARLLLEGEQESTYLRAGDYLLIPARRRHRVEWTSPDEPTIWLAVHYTE